MDFTTMIYGRVLMALIFENVVDFVKPPRFWQLAVQSLSSMHWIEMAVIT